MMTWIGAGLSGSRMSPLWFHAQRIGLGLSESSRLAKVKVGVGKNM